MGRIVWLDGWCVEGPDQLYVCGSLPQAVRVWWRVASGGLR